MIFCPKCGEAIPENSTKCPQCGEKLVKEEEQAVIYASQANVNTEASAAEVKTRTFSKIPKWIGFAIASVVILGAVFLGVNETGKASLKKELLRDWVYTDGSILKVLDFSDDEVEYRLETGYSWMDTTLGTYDYKIVSRNKIKIKMYGDKYNTYTIEFNDDRNMITVTPAITSTDSEENWFNFDD